MTDQPDLLEQQALIKARRRLSRDRSGQFTNPGKAAEARAKLLETTQQLRREVYRDAAPVKRHIRHLHAVQTEAPLLDAVAA